MSHRETSGGIAQPKTDGGFWDRLTSLRGWLALYVVLHHVRNELWPFMRDLSSADDLWYYGNAATSIALRFGLHAVFLFFVVSGLSIHFATISSRSDSFGVTNFYRRRLRRLQPALIASVAFSGILWVGILGGDMREQWLSMVATLTYQQSVLAGSFAGNSPYWSLANEGYYYLLYPAVLWLLARFRLPVGALLLTSIALSGVAWCLGIHHAIPIYAPVWLAGVWLAEQWQAKAQVKRVILGIGWLVVIASLLMTLAERQVPWIDLACYKALFGIALVVVVDAWLRLPVPAWLPAWLKQLSRALGEVSYSLYLNHFLIIKCLSKLYPDAAKHWESALATSVAALALSLGAAWASWRFVERPFLHQRQPVLPARVPAALPSTP